MAATYFSDKEDLMGEGQAVEVFVLDTHSFVRFELEAHGTGGATRQGLVPQQQEG